MNYRADIDGLRAVAILSVLFFHGFPHLLPGGFVGVDVFFVVSGYLISSQILDGLQARRFSFREFYLRRARRLLPALLLVLGFCVVAGWFLLSPSQYSLLGRDILAGLTFSSNIVFWSDAGYFDAPSATKPLLHLWSLGIEEQFYLIWPVALAMAWRHSRVTLLIGVVIAASFACNIILVKTGHKVAAFYLPLSRFWELLAGAAIVNLKGKSDGATAAGAVLIGLSIVFVREFRFPGWPALMPVVGTMMMIAGGNEASINRLLGHRSIAAIGLISYPLYMWHWPLLTFARIKSSAPLTAGETLLILLASVGLATLTYLVVERPIRTSRLAAQRTVWPGAGIGAALLSFVLCIMASQGFPQRLPEELRDIGSVQLDRAAWRAGTCFLGTGGGAFAAECSDQLPQGSPRLVLWGDSHAAMLYPGFTGLKQARAFRLSQFTSASCPPILGLDDPLNVSNCRRDNDRIFADIARLSPDAIVLAAYWKKYDLTLLAESLETIKKKANANRIILIGPAPDWGVNRNMRSLLAEAYLSKSILPERIRPDGQDEAVALDRRLRTMSEALGITYISALDFFCDPSGCLTRIGRSGDLTSFDEAHLNPPAARALVLDFSPAIFPTLRY